MISLQGSRIDDLSIIISDGHTAVVNESHSLAYVPYANNGTSREKIVKNKAVRVRVYPVPQGSGDGRYKDFSFSEFTFIEQSRFYDYRDFVDLNGTQYVKICGDFFEASLFPPEDHLDGALVNPTDEPSLICVFSKKGAFIIAPCNK